MRKPEINKVDVAVYSLALLGGAERAVHSEHIAAKCYDIAATQFSWQLPEYRDKGWPDKYITKTALEDAKNKDGLVVGAYALDTARDGWTLTAAGARWFHDNRERVESTLRLKPALSVMSKRAAERFVRSICDKKLFKQYATTGTLESTSVYAFTDFLSCSPDAPPNVVSSKFRHLQSQAELLQDQKLIAFLNACGDVFQSVLNPEQDLNPPRR
jgi:hypothetical protein